MTGADSEVSKTREMEALLFEGESDENLEDQDSQAEVDDSADGGVALTTTSAGAATGSGAPVVVLLCDVCTRSSEDVPLRSRLNRSPTQL